MARYSYTVQDNKGETSSGAIEAADENEAISALQAKGYFILSISADKTVGGKAGGPRPRRRQGRRCATWSSSPSSWPRC